MNSFGTIGHVARREYLARVGTKAFLLATLITLVVIVGGLVLYSATSDDTTERDAVGVVGSAQLATALTDAGTALDRPLDVRELGDEQEARSQVTDGTLSAALVPGVIVLTESDLDPGLAAAVNAAVSQGALDRALSERGVDAAGVASDLSAATVTVEAIDPPDPAEGQRTALAFASIFLLFFTVFTYGLYVATGVVEEKASRVVELLLSTITPLQLLAGKVIGIGGVGLTQVVVIGGAGLAAGTATGVITIGTTAIGLFATVLVFYVLGFAFFALLYAAAGSLVSRQEDINSVATPLNLLAFGGYLVAQFALTDPSGTAARVLAVVPPFSAYLIPLRVAQNQGGVLEVGLAVALLLVACVVAALVAARIYQRSVLHTGSKQSWRTALRRA